MMNTPYPGIWPTSQIMKVVTDGPLVEATYHSELCRAMTWLGEQEKTVFIGQGVAPHGGTTMSDTFGGVPVEKRIEYPVAEEMQVGMCVGMSLCGFVPICIIPRWNFMLRAADQIVNHMDALPLYSCNPLSNVNGYYPKVIIRVAVPSAKPFNPGPQHSADFTSAFGLMLRTTTIVTLDTVDAIVPAYRKAFESPGSTILVEFTEFYKNQRGLHAGDSTYPREDRPSR